MENRIYQRENKILAIAKTTAKMELYVDILCCMRNGGGAFVNGLMGIHLSSSL